MNQNLKRYRSFLSLSAGVLYKNPVLALGLGLEFAVMGTLTLRMAAALSIAAFITVLPLVLLSATLGRRIPAHLRTTFNVLLAAAVLCVARDGFRVLSPTIFESLGIYYMLMAVSAVLLVQTGEAAGGKSVLRSLLSGFANCVGFSVLLLAVAAVRECLAGGTLWGITVTAPLLTPSVRLPFFGFILVGFFAAGFRFFSFNVKRLLARLDKKSESDAAGQPQ